MTWWLVCNQTSEPGLEHRSAFRSRVLPHPLATAATCIAQYWGRGWKEAYPPTPTGPPHWHSISSSSTILGCGLVQQWKDLERGHGGQEGRWRKEEGRPTDPPTACPRFWSSPDPRVPTFHFLGQWHMECLYSHPVTAEKILINILESLV